MNNEYNVVIVGGGPAGSTAGCLLKKYMPNLSVLILEKAKFPRDHVGESQLPMIGRVLREMGCWEKCEAADFPIKVGATYRWGNSDELWDFNFVDPEQVEELTRPGNYEGPRVSTAWQVDRAVYDEILLDHAQEMGCVVRQESQVTKIVLDESDSDAIGHLVIKGSDSESYEVRGRHYIDASGGVGVLRTGAWDWCGFADDFAECCVLGLLGEYGVGRGNRGGWYAGAGAFDWLWLVVVYSTWADTNEYWFRLPGVLL